MQHQIFYSTQFLAQVFNWIKVKAIPWPLQHLDLFCSKPVYAFFRSVARCSVLLEDEGFSLTVNSQAEGSSFGLRTSLM